MKTLNCEWSDGTKFILFESQIWEDKVNGDYTIEILKIDEEYVTIKFLETGACHEHELGGSDGFVDFLETCCYTERKV